jgi:lyso-ornithine lipid O-acyltransferase
MRPKALLRLAGAAFLALALIPVQMAALRLGHGLAARLPVTFHRMLIAILGIRVLEAGRIDERRPLLIVANHVSWLDIPVIGSRGPVSFIAKSEVEGWPLIGLFARLQRSVFIERSRRHRTAAATSAIGARLKAGDPMVLFGEGTTGDGTTVLPFRSALIGSAHEAVAGDRPCLVQPMAIRYVRRSGLPISRAAMPEIAWTGDMELAPHLAGIVGGGPIDVVVSWGEAMPVDAGTDRKTLARKLEATVRRLRDVEPRRALSPTERPSSPDRAGENPPHAPHRRP